MSSRHSGRGLSRRALANELRQRGVDGEVASEALGTLDEETEAETARALVERKLRTARGEPGAVFRRLVAMLARKGYPPGVAIRAVKDALAAQSAEAAEFAEQIDADALADAEGELDRDNRSPGERSAGPRKGPAAEGAPRRAAEPGGRTPRWRRGGRAAALAVGPRAGGASRRSAEIVGGARVGGVWRQGR